MSWSWSCPGQPDANVHFAFSTLMIINPSPRGVRPAMETPKPAFYCYGNGPEARGNLSNVARKLETC